MKNIILSSLVILTMSTTAFAQEQTKGFYLNPNISLTARATQYRHYDPMATPSLGIGYLWGSKNRHNVSISSIGGGLDKHNQQLNLSARYSYDILLLRRKKLSLFVSPSLNYSFNYAHSGTNPGNPTDYKSYYHRFTVAAAPIIEYSVGKRMNLTFSTPIILGENFMSKTKAKTFEKVTTNQQTQPNFLPRLEANIGLRINLFRGK